MPRDSRRADSESSRRVHRGPSKPDRAAGVAAAELAAVPGVGIAAPAVIPALRTAVLSRGFYDRPTLEVAEDLLGKVLVHRTPAGVTAGAIVEVEAYIGEDDPACHAAPGPTPRNAPLYGEPGHAYVYLNYGIHYLLNAVTEGAGRPAAVLIRALEPLEGLPLMGARRGAGVRHIPTSSLCRGPGNLSRALGITLAENRLDLTRGPLSIEDRALARAPVCWGPRIGIRVAVDRPWRCWLAGHPAVSGSRRQAQPLHPGVGASISHRTGP